jgi:putative peptidoglycan lipid II flippase
VAGVREAIRNFLPVVGARGVVNLSGWIDMILAHILVIGAPAMLGYAQTLYLLPISLFGMAIAASELPELSRKRGEVDQVLVPRVREALERIFFLLIPSALAYLALGDVFIAALFQGGAFGADGTLATYVILAAYSLGLPASASSRALSSAFYALRDTRTPARIATIRVLISIAVGAALMFPLDRFGVGELRFGAAGLGLGSAVGAWFEYFQLRSHLGRHLGPHAPAGGRIARLVLAGLGAAAVGFGAKQLLGFSGKAGFLAGALGETSVWLDPLAALGTAGAFGVAYLGMASLMKVALPLRKQTREGS